MKNGSMEKPQSDELASPAEDLPSTTLSNAREKSKNIMVVQRPWDLVQGRNVARSPYGTVMGLVQTYDK